MKQFIITAILGITAFFGGLFGYGGQPMGAGGTTSTVPTTKTPYLNSTQTWTATNTYASTTFHNGGVTVASSSLFSGLVTVTASSSLASTSFTVLPYISGSGLTPTASNQLATKSYADAVGASGFTSANVSTTLGLQAIGASPTVVGINASSTGGAAFDSNGALYFSHLIYSTTTEFASNSFTTDALAYNKNLHVIVYVPSATSGGFGMQFNGDSGTNYNYCQVELSGAISHGCGAATSYVIMAANGANFVNGYFTSDIINYSGLGKRLNYIGSTKGDANLNGTTGVGAWVSTTPISTITLLGTALATGTTIQIYGYDR